MASAKQTCIGVVFVETRRTLFKSDQAGRRENAGLAHASTERLAIDARAIDGGARADEYGAYRCAEALGEAEVYGVEAARQLCDADAQSDGRIEDTRSVEMRGQAGVCGPLPDLFVNRKSG